VVPGDCWLRTLILILEDVHDGGAGLGTLELERVQDGLAFLHNNEQPLNIAWTAGLPGDCGPGGIGGRCG
jgi:hypothetical protein